MDKIVKFIDLHVPVTNCNLKCHYCYVAKNGCRDSKKTFFKYSPEQIVAALKQERLGGICHFNMCGHGETLLPRETTPITKGLLENGHYIMIVTNGLVTKRLEEMVLFPPELKKRLGFKFSFHYLELLRTRQLKQFIANIKMVRKSGCSFSIEITPSDELIPHIPDIKKLLLDEFGTLCHITVPRDGNSGSIPLLSKYSIEKFKNIWSSFDSDLFDFKISTWDKKRCEYCYAGAWSALLDLENGEMYSCYGSPIHTNIFKNIDKPIKFRAVGKHCSQPHCYNSHSFLTYGAIPEMGNDIPPYSAMRDRIDILGHWLTPEMYETMSQKLYDNNPLHNKKDMRKTNMTFYWALVKRFLNKFPDKIKYEINRRK